MTALLDIELGCPICLKTFKSHVVLRPHTSGRRRTDFHEEATGLQPLPYFVHTCPTCGYSGDEGDFSREARVDPKLVARVWEELTPKVAGAAMTGSEKHELAAKVAEWQCAEPWEIADLLLRAAWCCVDEGDVEAERYFRRKAARMFEAALERSGFDDEHRAVVTYLVGELWRRVGDVKSATRWFNRVQSEIVAPVRQRWVLQAARRQRDDPREWFEG